MSRRTVSVTLDNLDDLPTSCRRCVFWELDPLAMDRAVEAGDTAFEKESWVSATLLEWGSCGKIVYVDGVPAGFALFAPPTYVPRAVAFPTSPVSPDAVLLMTAHVLPDFQGGGLGRVLLQAVAKDLTRRGVRAIEAFGYDGPGGTDAAAEEGAGTLARTGRTPGGGACMLPAHGLRAVGFKTVRPHHRYPRLRLELKTAVSWREDVEVALEKLLGSMSPDPLLRPV